MMQLSAGRGTRRHGRVAAAGLGLGTLAAQLLVVVGLHAGVASASPGSLDSTFGSGGTVVTSGDGQATGVGVLSNGDLAVSAGGAAPTSSFLVNLYDGSGNQIGGWPRSIGTGEANALVVTPGDEIIAAGASATAGCSQPAIVGYDSAGSQIFSTVIPTCPANKVLNAVAYDGSSGDVVAVGTESSSGSAVRQSFVEWINPGSGGIDHGPFDTLPQTAGTAVAVTNGEAIVGGAFDGTPNLVAVTSSGAFNSSFGTSGTLNLAGGPLVTGLASLPGGDVVAAVPSSGTSSTVTDVTASGHVVRSFGVTGWTNSIAYQPLGNLVTVGGYSTAGVRPQQMFLEQFDASTGAVNGNFGSGGSILSGASGSVVNAVATQTDGKVVGVGDDSAVAAVPSLGVIRVFGPSLSLQSPGTVQDPSLGTFPVDFTATIDEPLFNDVTATFCSSTGLNVNGGGSCGTVIFPHGQTSETVPVTVNVALPDVENSQTLVAQSSGGLAQSLTNGSATATILPIPGYPGYRLVGSDGGIFNYASPYWGSHGGSPLNKPIVGMATTLSGDGYYLLASDGGIFNYGPGAVFHGSHGGSPLNKPIVGMALDPATGGYWMVASDGGIFNYGAPYFGSHGGSPLNQPIVGMASTPDGGGYWLVAADGGIFNYGNAAYLGSHGGNPLNKPIVGMAASPVAQGYWLVASDGGIFNYGNAPYEGSHGGSPLNKPIVGMTSNTTGTGYWLVASDGGIFNYNAPYEGSHGGSPLNQPIVGMSK